jgi:predicted TPR repeat methyltransferase
MPAFDAKKGITLIMDQGSMVAAYDDEAEATGWYGPEVAFGLTYAYVQPGQSILDIGIGTGLGSILFRKAGLEVYGMDISPQMLDACRSKGFTSLQLHDLSKTPYPYDSESMDHAVCSGVLNFFSDLSLVFQEAGRILRNGGLFVFVVGDRNEGEVHEVKIGSEHTKTGETVTMYKHSPDQIDIWMKRFGFRLMRSLAFRIFMDRERTMSMQAKTYLARKVASIEPAASVDARSSRD